MSTEGVIRVSGISPAWRLLRCRTEPRTVTLMLEDIEDAGYQAYMPQYLRRRRVYRSKRLGTKLEWVSEPLFRGYVFVRRDADYNPKPMERCYGIEGKEIGAVADILIHRIRIAEDSFDITRDGEVVTLRGIVQPEDRRFMPAVYIPPDQQRLALKAGDEVEFDLLGRFVRGVVTANMDGRIAVLTEFMGQASRFVVDIPNKVRAVEGGHLERAAKRP